MSELKSACLLAKKSLPILQEASHTLRCKVISDLSLLLEKNKNYLITENKKDIENARINNRPEAMVDRLTLTEERISGMSSSLNKVASLPDPLGHSVGHIHPKGMKINRVTVPLGIIAVIFESRPNVTVDIAALAIKTGNGAILRGGSEAINTNLALSKLISKALEDNNLPADIIYLVKDTSRATADELLTLRGYIDILIPRGGASLIQHTVNNAKVPVIETGAGICHVYIDETADFDMALNILENAKTQRPSVCNAAETLICHKNIANKFLPLAKKRLDKFGVIWHGCEESIKILTDINLADNECFATEYNDLEINCRIVDNISNAIDHISQFGTLHSEAIVTTDMKQAKLFTSVVDAAVVYVNTSTRFTDGEEFGFGAEIGISTQKLPPRGPMGPSALTTIKYIVEGDGQIR